MQKPQMNKQQLLVDLKGRLQKAKHYLENLDEEFQFCSDCVGYEEQLERELEEAKKAYEIARAEALRTKTWRGRHPNDTHQADSHIWAPLKRAEHRLKVYRNWMETVTMEEVDREAAQIRRWAQQAVRNLEGRIRQLEPNRGDRTQWGRRR